MKKTLFVITFILSSYTFADTLTFTGKVNNELVKTPYQFTKLEIRAGNQLWLVNKYNNIQWLSKSGKYVTDSGTYYKVQEGKIVKSNDPRVKVDSKKSSDSKTNETL